MQPPHAGRFEVLIHQVAIDDNRQGSAIRQLYALQHSVGIWQETLQDSMNPTCVATALRRLFSFNGVELLQHFDRNRQVIVFEFEDRLGIVQKDVGVQHEGLGLRRTLELRLRVGDPAQVFHLAGNIL